jgi:hypothetical protein
MPRARPSERPHRVKATNILLMHLRPSQVARGSCTPATTEDAEENVAAFTHAAESAKCELDQV